MSASPRKYDPAEMARRGRLGAHVTHSLHDSRDVTRNARRAFLASFERQVDPNGELPIDERRRRAEHARRAHFQRLAAKSAAARRARTARDGEAA